MRWTARRPFGLSNPINLIDRLAPERPPDGARLLDRVRLRRAAVRYAAHGWPVTPGACLDGHRFDCGRPGCPIMACHPAIESWEDAASTDLDRVRARWRRRPHAVLLATGRAFDVLEVPATLGLRVLGAARLRAGVMGAGAAGADPLDPRGPVAVTPSGQWMFLVRPGEPLRSALEDRVDVVRHGPGSWIPAAPSRMPDGAVRWAVPPRETGWRLPGSAAVQVLLVDAIAATRHRRAHGGTGSRAAMAGPPQAASRVAAAPATLGSAVPRQVSTSRRAA